MSVTDLVTSSPTLTRFLMSHTPPSLFEHREVPFARRTLAAAIERTIAYPKFLIENGFDPGEARWERFEELPLMNKKVYLDQYPLRERCLDSDLHHMYVIERSSGVTGGCYYWPRLPWQDESLVAQVDMGLRMYYGIETKPTLLVCAFALGTWVGGVKTATMMRQLAASGKYPITVISPGVNIEEILQIVRDLSPEYEQTIIFGYPPFLKSVLDEGAARGMHWEDYHIRLGTSGEGYPEEWRESTARRLGMDPDRDLLGIMGGYGAADLGNGVAQEYPTTVLVRRLCMRDSSLTRDLFGEDNIVPNLFQYDPGSVHPEVIDGELVFTVMSAVPLVRYAIRDLGGLIPFEHALTVLADHGYDVHELMRERGFGDAVWPFPFLYCHGRADGTVTVGGVNMYPENIGAVLASIEDADIAGYKLTVRDDRLTVLLEHHEAHLSETGIGDLCKRYHQVMVEGLPKVNSEFRALLAADPRIADPLVEVHAAGSGPFADDIGRLKRRYTVGGHPEAA